MTLSINRLTDPEEIMQVLDIHKDCLLSLSKGEVYRKEMAEKYSGKGVFIIAKTEDRPVGFCAFYANDDEHHTAFISMIAVHPDFRRHHIGILLLTETFNISKSLGMKQIKLEVVKTNNAAIAFYLKNGFEFFSDENVENKKYMIKNL